MVWIAPILISFPLWHLVQTAQAKSEPIRVEVDLKNRSPDVHFYNVKVVLDLEKKSVVKVLAPVKEELSQKEKRRASKIDRERFFKNFAYNEGDQGGDPSCSGLKWKTLWATLSKARDPK